MFLIFILVVWILMFWLFYWKNKKCNAKYEQIQKRRIVWVKKLGTSATWCFVCLETRFLLCMYTFMENIDVEFRVPNFFSKRSFQRGTTFAIEFQGINHFLPLKTSHVTGAHRAKSNFVTHSWSNDRVITLASWISVLFLYVCARSNFQLCCNT